MKFSGTVGNERKQRRSRFGDVLIHHLDPGVFRDGAIVSICIWAPRPRSFDQTITILRLSPQVRILPGCLSSQPKPRKSTDGFFPRNQLSFKGKPHRHRTEILQRCLLAPMCLQTVFYAAVPYEPPCWHLCISTRRVLPDAARVLKMVCFVSNVSCFSGETLPGSIFKWKTMYPAASSTGGDGANAGLTHRVNQSGPH